MSLIKYVGWVKIATETFRGSGTNTIYFSFEAAYREIGLTLAARFIAPQSRRWTKTARDVARTHSTIDHA
jgi:hypothetical protein